MGNRGEWINLRNTTSLLHWDYFSSNQLFWENMFLYLNLRVYSLLTSFKYTHI